MIAALSLLLIASPAAAQVKLKSLCDIHYPSDAGIEWQCRKLKWTDTPQALFGGHWQDVLRFNRMDRRHFYGGISIKVPKKLEQVQNFSPLPLTHPEAAGERKFILIDQSEMFLGAYQDGKLVHSYPVAVGVEKHPVPNGTFRIDAADRQHKSNMYRVEEIGRPYPMHYALRFFVDKSVDTWPSYWIHGRDLPGYPASHGCIGLYDEEMQDEYYKEYDRKVNKHFHELSQPFLEGAKTLYQWVVNPATDPGGFHKIQHGPKVLIVGTPPSPPAPRSLPAVTLP
jgi:hypothetical protein